jgi:hypothetical protein
MSIEPTGKSFTFCTTESLAAEVVTSTRMALPTWAWVRVNVFAVAEAIDTQFKPSDEACHW